MNEVMLNDKILQFSIDGCKGGLFWEGLKHRFALYHHVGA